MEHIDEVEYKIDNHIDVCTVRYESLDLQIKAVNSRLKRLENVGLSVAGTIILLLLHLVFK